MLGAGPRVEAGGARRADRHHQLLAAGERVDLQQERAGNAVMVIVLVGELEDRDRGQGADRLGADVAGEITIFDWRARQGQVIAMSGSRGPHAARSCGASRQSRRQPFCTPPMVTGRSSRTAFVPGAASSSAATSACRAKRGRNGVGATSMPTLATSHAQPGPIFTVSVDSFGTSLELNASSTVARKSSGSTGTASSEDRSRSHQRRRRNLAMRSSPNL